MPQNNSWLPLFPLKAVLFPDGILPLKIFETRYIDMVRECMRKETPFGVVLIKSGQEVGLAAEPEPVGTLAHIIDWDMQDGLMLLNTRGGERFQVLETRILGDQRLEARVEMLAADRPAPVSDIHVVCAKALKIVMDAIAAKAQDEQGNGLTNPLPNPMRFDNASWVANRWCELLPIPLKARQKLLELDDAQSRLSLVHQYLQQHKII